MHRFNGLGSGTSPSLWEGIRSIRGGRSSINSSSKKHAYSCCIAESEKRSSEQFTLPGGHCLWQLPPTLPEGGCSKPLDFLHGSVVFFCLLFLIAMLGCDAKQKSGNANKDRALTQRIAVTNYPLYCIASSICRDTGGPVKEVIYIGPPKGVDPHGWIPSADQIRDLQNVDLIVCNGPGAVFANWMDKVTIDNGKLLKTTDAIKATEFVVVKDHQLVHSHGPEGEHSHSWVVPQSWLSPRIARKQATLCFDRLVEMYGPSPKLDNGFAEVQKKFDALEAAGEQIAKAYEDLIVASSTPEVQYLTLSLIHI